LSLIVFLNVMLSEARLLAVYFRYDETDGALSFCVSELKKNLEKCEHGGVQEIIFEKSGKASAKLKSQGFSIKRLGDKIHVSGGDSVGCMYGGLELAEQWLLKGSLDKVTDVSKSPAIQQRGIKFNIPLDVRTPSYDDTGDAAQKNIGEMWNFDFWKEFFDQMARDRYNVLTLWNDHPFPSLVKIPEFPNVALDNVCVGVTKPDWTTPNWNLMKTELEVLKKMTIDEKIVFWNKVLQYAKDRGVAVYWITWNVKVHGAVGKYGINYEQNNPQTIAYMRACIRELLLTYPLLKGVGTTAGEQMHTREDEYDREKWLWNTYGEGVLDAKKKQPGREVNFIHRVWYSGLDKMERDFLSKYPDPLDISFKYAQARLYASTKPIWGEGLLEKMESFPDLKSWWNLRNDDIFVFRWGDPEYVRDFIGNFPKGRTAGYYVGSDGYVWGREFLSKSPKSPRQLEIHKHWFSFMLWGRLGYDPNLSESFFAELLGKRFPKVDGEKLLDAWASSSKIIPLINRYHYRSWDHMWSVEGCLSKGGFHDVIDFVQMFPMKGEGMIEIPAYAKKVVAGEEVKVTSPLDVAKQLRLYAEEALGFIRSAKTLKGVDGELTKTLEDIEAFSYLGNYYASKIEGATALGLFLENGDSKYQKQSVKYLEQALMDWKVYANIASKNYKSQLLARTRDMDWTALIEDVEKDIAIAKNPMPMMEFKKRNPDLKKKEGVFPIR